MNNFKKLVLPALIFYFLLISCIGGGTHGYLKRYRYSVSKYVLEKAVKKIILESATIYQDTIKGYYNNDTNYISINIIEKELQNTYILHYYGGKDYWNTSKTSAISIVYAYDKKRNGGSSGNGGIRWYDFKLKKFLTKTFENELINKIDKELHITHSDE